MANSRSPLIQLMGLGIDNLEHSVEAFESAFDQEGSLIVINVSIKHPGYSKDTVRRLMVKRAGLFHDIEVRNVHHRVRDGAQVSRVILDGRYRLKAYSVRDRPNGEVSLKLTMTTMPKVIKG